MSISKKKPINQLETFEKSIILVMSKLMRQQLNRKHVGKLYSPTNIKPHPL